MKTALVTGAGGGIGQELMTLLESHGYRVIAHARTPDKASAAAGSRDHVYADLTDAAETASLRDQVGALTKTLDLLVCNAGVLTTSKAKGKRGLGLHGEVNVIAPLECTQALAPLLQASEDGTVVVVSSTAANFARRSDYDVLAEPDGSSLFGHYALSKAAANRLVVDMAAAMPDIRVLSTEPGFVDTAMTSGNASMPFFMRWLAPVVGAKPTDGAKRALEAALTEDFPSGSIVQGGKVKTGGSWATPEAKAGLERLLKAGGAQL